ncbi:MAG: crossover junction endodeoxyribonuclease RuvC [Thioalkalivibrio sp.]|nr:crossover junction endodeoxyribonuclease RuvC [Thioalkalivibrio sp.]
MRILGIDPGSRVTGFAVVDAQGNRLQACGFGVIRPGDGELPERIGEIFAGVVRVIADLQPAALAIESVFLAKNAQSALKLGQARGAAICAATHAGLPVFEYAPRAVKLAVVGSGRAEKAQVQHMMRQILQISEPLTADAADALAIAVCHAHTHSTRSYASRYLAALTARS